MASKDKGSLIDKVYDRIGKSAIKEAQTSSSAPFCPVGLLYQPVRPNTLPVFPIESENEDK